MSQNINIWQMKYWLIKTSMLARVKWLDTGLGLVIGFIAHLTLGITSNYCTITNSPHYALSLLRLLSFHQLLPGNSSQRCRFLSCHVPRVWLSLADAYLTTQLGTAWLQFSNMDYYLFPYSRRTALPNSWLQAVLICCWHPHQGPGPPFSDC
jgi:hypothetical protein